MPSSPLGLTRTLARISQGSSSDFRDILCPGGLCHSPRAPSAALFCFSLPRTPGHSRPRPQVGASPCQHWDYPGPGYEPGGCLPWSKLSSPLPAFPTLHNRSMFMVTAGLDSHLSAGAMNVDT